MAKKKRKAQTPKQLKIAVGVAIAILFILGLLQIVQGFIDTRNYSQQIVDAIEKQTNRKVTIKGPVSVSLLPTPTLYILGLELRDLSVDKPVPAVTVEMISIQIPLMSVFSNHINVSSVVLGRPVLELVRADDNLIYWDWMNTDLLKVLSASDVAEGKTLDITITDGKILYRDDQTEKKMTVENINSTIFAGKSTTAKGGFRIAGHDMTFAMDTHANNKDGTPFLLNVNSGAKDSLELKGDLNMSGDLPDLKGTFALKLENAPTWVKAITPQETHLFQEVTNQFRNKDNDQVMLPLNITSNWSQHGLSVAMDKVMLQGLDSGGAGKIDLTWTDWRPDILVDMNFSGFNYDQWSQLLTVAFAKSNTGAIVYHEVNEVADNPIPKNVSITLNLKADQLFYGQQIWKDAQMSTHIGAGTVTVNQFNVKLQGDSVVTIFGVISPSATSDLRFEGSMETSGKSLRQMLTVFDETAADLPETGFGDFFAHSNMFISSEQLRLSEADVKLGDLHLNGGLVAYFDSNPRIEADIKLKNINFDYFRDVWREKQKNADEQEDFFLKFDRSMNFSWLKKLQTAIDFKVYVEHFTFLDRNGDNASFRLYARSGDLGIYDINFIYPSDITKGYFKLNVNAEQPALTLNLTTGDLNTDYFNIEPYKHEPLVSSSFNPISTPNASDTAQAPEVPVPDSYQAPYPVPDIPDMEASDSDYLDVELYNQEPLALPPLTPLPLATEPVNASDTAQVSEDPVPDPYPIPYPLPDTLDMAASAPASKDAEGIKKLDIQPQAATILLAANDDIEPPRQITGVDELVKQQKKVDPYYAGENKKHWDEKLLDMSWLNGYSGELELNATHLIHKDVSLGNLKLKASFGNDLVLFKTLSFSYWGGQCSIVGSLYGGKVPGFSISFTLVDAQVQQLLASLTERHNISGQVSMSASLTSSGVNMLSWVSQADGKVVLIGRNIYVQGINMQGVVDSVAISRTSPDVLSSVNRSLFNGYTIFSVDGNLNVKDGMIRTPGISLRAASTIGNMKGELRLVPWTLELSALFQFPVMSSATVPTLVVQYSGTPDEGELKTDTSSLESFVAKRIISQ